MTDLHQSPSSPMAATGPSAADASDGSLDGEWRPAHQLDDRRDRSELRRRYEMLLQESRVLLPGVQLLVAFLLTAPFADRFHEIDPSGKALYGVSLTSGLLAVLALTTPIAMHRFGDRVARSQRLVWSIRASRLGVALLGISLVSAFALIMRLVFDGLVAVLLVGLVLAAITGAWVVLPRMIRPHRSVEA